MLLPPDLRPLLQHLAKFSEPLRDEEVKEREMKGRGGKKRQDEREEKEEGFAPKG